MNILKTVGLFIFGGLCEIGGAYLIWLWLKDNKPIYYGVSGAIILSIYGIVSALHNTNFGKVFAVYGGVFILLSYLWSIKFYSYTLDKFDGMGMVLIFMGIAVIYYSSYTD